MDSSIYDFTFEWCGQQLTFNEQTDFEEKGEGEHQISDDQIIQFLRFLHTNIDLFETTRYKSIENILKKINASERDIISEMRFYRFEVKFLETTRQYGLFWSAEVGRNHYPLHGLFKDGRECKVSFFNCSVAELKLRDFLEKLNWEDYGFQLGIPDE